MSKRKKARQKIRNNRDPVPVARKPAMSSSQTHTITSRRASDQAEEPTSRRVRVRTRYLPEGGAVDERLPDYTITVDLTLLREHGLQPEESDLDLVAQQFRRIKRPVLNTAFGLGASDSQNANVIMLASALPKSGKSFCSFNLATSIARERDVGAVLVDADVLKPEISRVLGLDGRLGLIDYLLDSTVSFDEILVATDLHGIVVVPAGQQHDEATELLASRRMQKFVAELSMRFYSRAIIVDTPPLLLTNEAHVLAENMGQIILVVEAGVSTQASVIQALESFNRTKPINAILNKARGVSFGEYDDGYGYYSAPQRGRKYGNDEAQQE